MAILGLILLIAAMCAMVLYAIFRAINGVMVVIQVASAATFMIASLLVLIGVAQWETAGRSMSEVQVALETHGLTSSQAEEAIGRVTVLEAGEWLVLNRAVTVVRGENSTYFIGPAEAK